MGKEGKIGKIVSLSVNEEENEQEIGSKIKKEESMREKITTVVWGTLMMGKEAKTGKKC